jgi:protein phosphatase-4 regulatory subunit 3
MSVDIPTSPRRVKVYELDGDQWIDNGTGYCSGVIGDEKAYLSVKNEANESELLLRSHIRGTIQYQKQQSTLIVWSEPDKKDIALSFQEADGCDLVCDFLAYVQRNMENEISIVSIVTNDGEAEVSEVIAGPVHRPPEPKIGNLGEVVEALSLAAVSPNGRDSVIKYIHETHYISQLVELLEVAEDLESLTDLHNLCRIMKILCK